MQSFPVHAKDTATILYFSFAKNFWENYLIKYCKDTQHFIFAILRNVENALEVKKFIAFIDQITYLNSHDTIIFKEHEFRLPTNWHQEKNAWIKIISAGKSTFADEKKIVDQLLIQLQQAQDSIAQCKLTEIRKLENDLSEALSKVSIPFKDACLVSQWLVSEHTRLFFDGISFERDINDFAFRSHFCRKFQLEEATLDWYAVRKFIGDNKEYNHFFKDIFDEYIYQRCLYAFRGINYLHSDDFLTLDLVREYNEKK